MADFCYSCTGKGFGEAYAARNDMRNIAQPGGWAWLLCEGCGFHAFDQEGKRPCDSRDWYDDQDAKLPMFGPCEKCQEIVGVGGIEPPT